MVELGARAGLEGGQADHRDADQVTIMDSASPELGGGIGGLGHALMAEMRALREVVAGVVIWREIQIGACEVSIRSEVLAWTGVCVRAHRG